MVDTAGWDEYWQGSRSGIAYGSEGADHPGLSEFWRKQLAEISDSPLILDVASGRGALYSQLAQRSNCVVVTDYSLAALSAQRELYSEVLPVVADAGAMPFSKTANVVVSQFGVEYGGAEAVLSTINLVADGGRLMLVMHADGSLIHQECSLNVRVLEQLNETMFIPLARDMFSKGYGVLRGEVDKGVAGDAARKLLPAFRAVGDLLDRYGEYVAGGTLQQLYSESARIQQRISQYVESDVLGWLTTMENEIESYRGRMESMCAAALSERQFDDFVKHSQECGLAIQYARSVDDGHGKKLGWGFSARRP